MKYYFDQVDDCIMAAYDHVKRTGCKMSHYDEFRNGMQTHLGYQSEDGDFFIITKSNHNSSNKRKLARMILSSGIDVIDVVNKQLLAFL
jgi:hypothetical protein